MDTKNHVTAFNNKKLLLLREYGTVLLPQMYAVLQKYEYVGLTASSAFHNTVFYRETVDVPDQTLYYSLLNKSCTDIHLVHPKILVIPDYDSEHHCLTVSIGGGCTR